MKRTFKVDPFFGKMRRLGLALTYDEVRLQTGYSDNDPNDASLLTRFSRNVPLRCPIVSAAMDTVIQRFGGIQDQVGMLLQQLEELLVTGEQMHVIRQSN